MKNVLLLPLLLLLALPAGAAVSIYHSASDDGSVSPPVTVSGVVFVNVWLDAGSTASTHPQPCDGQGLASGEELCGYGIEFTASGDLQIQSFTPEIGVDSVIFPGGGTARAIAVPLSAVLGPTRVGVLVVSGTDGDLRVDTPSGLGFVDVTYALNALGAPGGVVLAATDADGDGEQDPFDNCPGVANPLQEDDGGLDTAVPDGIGNACQCGELTDDGIVDAADVLAARQHLVGAPPLAPTPLLRCNVIGPSDGGVSDCDVADVYWLRHILGGAPGALGTDCAVP